MNQYVADSDFNVEVFPIEEDNNSGGPVKARESPSASYCRACRG